MLENHSTAALEAELQKRKALAPLESAVRETLANGISMHDIHVMLARVGKEQEANVRNLAAGKY